MLMNILSFFFVDPNDILYYINIEYNYVRYLLQLILLKYLILFIFPRKFTLFVVNRYFIIN